MFTKEHLIALPSTISCSEGDLVAVSNKTKRKSNNIRYCNKGVITKHIIFSIVYLQTIVQNFIAIVFWFILCE